MNARLFVPIGIPCSVNVTTVAAAQDPPTLAIAIATTIVVEAAVAVPVETTVLLVALVPSKRGVALLLVTEERPLVVPIRVGLCLGHLATMAVPDCHRRMSHLGRSGASIVKMTWWSPRMKK